MLQNNCNYGISNTGTGCTPLFTVTKKIYLRPYYSSQGIVNTILLNPPGTIYTASSSTTLTGIGTTFKSTFNPGDTVVVGTGATSQRFIIASITSDTVMVSTVASPATIATPGVAYNQLCKAYFDALINYPDPSKRLYPLPAMKNAKDTREKSIFQTWDDGTMSIVQQGPRKFTAMFTSQDKAASAQLKNQLDSITGQNDVGFYALAIDRNLWGALNTSGQLDLRRIDQGSFEVIYNPGDDKGTSTIEMTFCVHEDEDDGLIASIANDEMSADLQSTIQRLVGLLDVSPVYSAIGTGGFTVQLNTLFNTPKNPLTVKGLVAKNFVSSSTNLPGQVYDITTTADVAVTVAEVLSNGRPTGVYVVAGTFSSADHAQPNIVADGYDFTEVNTVPIVIP